MVTEGLGERGARARDHEFAQIYRRRSIRVSVNCRLWVWEESGKGRLGLDLPPEGGRTRSSWSGLCVERICGGYVVRGESVVLFSQSFKRRTTARIVFQLRVVAGTPNSLSTWPR